MRNQLAVGEKKRGKGWRPYDTPKWNAVEEGLERTPEADGDRFDTLTARIQLICNQ